MPLYLYNTETDQTAKIPVQSDGECLWVNAPDLPTWANPVSANFALHQLLLDGEPEYLHEGVWYLVPAEDPADHYPVCAYAF